MIGRLFKCVDVQVGIREFSDTCGQCCMIVIWPLSLCCMLQCVPEITERQQGLRCQSWQSEPGGNRQGSIHFSTDPKAGIGYGNPYKALASARQLLGAYLNSTAGWKEAITVPTRDPKVMIQ